MHAYWVEGNVLFRTVSGGYFFIIGKRNEYLKINQLKKYKILYVITHVRMNKKSKIISWQKYERASCRFSFILRLEEAHA